MKRVALLFFCALALAPDAAAADAPLRASTSLSPRPAFFGQLVTARAEVVVDSRRVDASSVRFTPSFAPYASVAPPRKSRTDANGTTTLGFVFTLSCLDDGCLPRGTSARAVKLPKAEVQADGAELPVEWPEVVVTPRVTARDAGAARPPWRVQLGLPPVTYRTQPGAATPLTAVAILLAALGVAVVANELVRRRRLILERERRRSALARALELVRESEGRTVEDRRKALSLLARLLAAENGDGQLAGSAERLAWARSEPSPARIGELVREVEAKVART